MRADAMENIIKTFQILQELLGMAADITHDTEVIARILGVASQMNKLDFFFLVWYLVKYYCGILTTSVRPYRSCIQHPKAK